MAKFHESVTVENRLLKEEIQRAQQLENSLREELRQSDAERVQKATLNEELNKKELGKYRKLKRKTKKQAKIQNQPI